MPVVVSICIVAGLPGFLLPLGSISGSGSVSSPGKFGLTVTIISRGKVNAKDSDEEQHMQIKKIKCFNKDEVFISLLLDFEYVSANIG